MRACGYFLDIRVKIVDPRELRLPSDSSMLLRMMLIGKSLKLLDKCFPSLEGLAPWRTCMDRVCTMLGVPRLPDALQDTL